MGVVRHCLIDNLQRFPDPDDVLGEAGRQFLGNRVNENLDVLQECAPSLDNDVRLKLLRTFAARIYLESRKPRVEAFKTYPSVQTDDLREVLGMPSPGWTFVKYLVGGYLATGISAGVGTVLHYCFSITINLLRVPIVAPIITPAYIVCLLGGATLGVIESSSDISPFILKVQLSHNPHFLDSTPGTQDELIKAIEEAETKAAIQ